MLQERTKISNVSLITLKIYREAGAGLVGIAEKQSFPNRKKKNIKAVQINLSILLTTVSRGNAYSFNVG